MSRQVTCINKQDRYSSNERISHIGGSWGRITEDEAIRQINAGTQSYHVRVGVNDVKVIVAYREGRPYLKTERDGTTADNLLSLPEC